MGEVLKLRQKVLFLLVAGLLAVALVPSGCTVVKGRQSNQQEPLPTTDIAPLGNRILIVSPHPDDEGLATGGLLQQAVSGHVDVRVVVVTTGDGSTGGVRSFSQDAPPSKKEFLKMGNARCQDTRDALATLGLPANDVIFLTYADGSVNSLWDVDWDYSKLHTGRTGTDHSPYTFSYEKNAPYCGANLAKNLSSIVKDYRPTAVVYPDEQDQHHDHWAVNAFVQYVVLSSGYRGAEYTYLVHRNDFCAPRSYAPLGYLEPPGSLRTTGAGWRSLPLSRRQQDNKARALREYTTPRSVREPFIDSFVRRNELIRKEVVDRPKQIGDAKPDFTAKPMPYVVEKDPSYDSATPMALGGGELTRVSFCVGDARAFLALATRGDVLDNLTYAFRLRVFKGRKVDRFDIDVRERKARYVALASNSMILRGRIPVHEKENRLWIELPASVFTGKDACMLSVDTMDGPSRVDRTIWHRLVL
jgi:N-acetyl-1-D-myo-inositol-2-amino-2-deoxy-alpha-D-glucopyranoside deacetylase